MLFKLLLLISFAASVCRILRYDKELCTVWGGRFALNKALENDNRLKSIVSAIYCDIPINKIRVVSSEWYPDSPNLNPNFFVFGIPKTKVEAGEVCTRRDYGSLVTKYCTYGCCDDSHDLCCGPSAGVIVGIVISVIVFIAIVAAVVYFGRRRYLQRTIVTYTSSTPAPYMVTTAQTVPVNTTNMAAPPPPYKTTPGY